MRLPALLLSLLAITSAGGCTMAAEPASRGDVMNTLGQIKSDIGDAPCQNNSQCHSLALGAKACGGPEFYLPWSSEKNSAASLQTLADRYHGERRAQIAANGEISTCSMTVQPSAICGPAKHCVLQSGPSVPTADPT